MKLGRIASVLAFSALTCAVVKLPAAAAERRFACGSSSGVPATMAKTSRGLVPVIKWTSSHFSSSGYSPLRRCQIVSDKFQEYYETGQLNYLTTGRVSYPNQVDYQNVVCVAKARLGACNGVLFTLKPGSNPGRTLQRLMDVRLQASGPLNETSGRVYIEMEKFLNEAPVDQNASADPNAPTTGLW
ncbi:hypothetical protein C1752_02181 [Acaryochloris thomasi RCC1774]|uniref:Circadian oscillating protein COP23 n=1 Tax=Acaryochloris thomasi RCC1774 TaxID=1764569 RepID=A0A2W1JYQ1_9CYAN|nr:COP23 domain-containing protein [Acaryochloris thomasi]PZD73317.1 hypothetical protein C1752_02181 [Acaryochloris thomasi RCC1774]